MYLNNDWLFLQLIEDIDNSEEHSSSCNNSFFGIVQVKENYPVFGLLSFGTDHI